MVVEQCDWNAWLAGGKPQATALLKLAPVEVFEHGAETPDPMGTLF